MHSKSRGFTLLEVMIALGIFSICAMVLLQQSGRSARQTHALEVKTFANWIAENELERLRLKTALPSTGSSDTELLFARQKWLVTNTIESTSNPDLIRAEVRVQQGDHNQSNTYRLTGFLGRH